MGRQLRRRAVFWVLVVLLLVLAPLFALLAGARPEGRPFWVELSVALGFAGLALMGLQFLLTARIRYLTTPFGIDIVYHFHRQISVIATLLVLAHPIILFVGDPSNLARLNLIEAGWQARTGVLSVVALLALVVSSLWRQPLGLAYEPWRAAHGTLAVLAVALAMAHVAIVGYHVATPWKRALWIALPMLWIALLAYVRLIKPWLMLRRPYEVREVREERGGAYTLVLQPVGHPGFQFMPGQFAWLTLRGSPYTIREHPFSFSSSAAAGGQVAFTIKELGDFTATIKEARPGQRAYLDGPFGVFSVDRNLAPGYVFVAGGVGITPIMSMLRTLADRRDPRPLLLLYANKTWDEATFREELDSLVERLALKVVHVIEEPDDGWQGERGFVDAEILGRYVPEER
ncbi:MAG TPA: ferric reductase-like transmembrane domain-containing protein, partial [Chloroflexaceae bacterium]|nr:ferric reductase-like transmembrane domain-containing protein [Chloroflexaceae bacterium]